jgi:hypothetical protein
MDGAAQSECARIRGPAMSRPLQPSSLALRSIDLLQGLSTERLDEISRQCAWRHFEAGQTLIRARR